ncbi:serine hydrolase domain-containing protein [Streptomyces antimycoticus]|uniref:serine hydrolase domain-containing protein n=1 Tax=Streptomyces antimycoticus TaxID=68175 RepID=UPI0025712979|nr:serine hydrolase domain-containing protein [Streptomyces antimycoticus]WJE00733.1 serine hydrolase domain-containing protein [Streptomyces antimycoticus]
MTTLPRELSPTVAAVFAAVDAERQRLGVPGAVVAVRSPDAEPWSVALGVRDIATDEPLAVDAVLRVGSVTKTIVATVVLRLTERGELGLDDDIVAHLPHVRVPSGVTVRRLLDMTAGLPEYTTEEFMEISHTTPDRVWGPQELLDLAFREPHRFAPGSSWDYCNAGYILLGMLAEHVTGDLVEDLARKLVLDPLGLHDTSLPPRSAAGTSLPDATVRGYHRVGAELVDTTDVNPSWAWTAGNAISTADDLVVLVEALVRGDLLAEETQRARLAGVPVPGTDWSYGLGIANFGGIWGHNGELPGFQAFAGHEPGTGRTIVVLANVDKSTDEVNPADTLAALVRRHLAPGTA